MKTGSVPASQLGDDWRATTHLAGKPAPADCKPARGIYKLTMARPEPPCWEAAVVVALDENQAVTMHPDGLHHWDADVGTWVDIETNTPIRDSRAGEWASVPGGVVCSPLGTAWAGILPGVVLATFRHLGPRP
jgi:hypothetical protein